MLLTATISKIIQFNFLYRINMNEFMWVLLYAALLLLWFCPIYFRRWPSTELICCWRFMLFFYYHFISSVRHFLSFVLSITNYHYYCYVKKSVAFNAYETPAWKIELHSNNDYYLYDWFMHWSHAFHLKQPHNRKVWCVIFFHQTSRRIHFYIYELIYLRHYTKVEHTESERRVRPLQNYLTYLCQMCLLASSDKCHPLLKKPKKSSKIPNETCDVLLIRILLLLIL